MGVCVKMKLAIISAGIVILLIAAYFAVGNYFYNYALNATNKKDFLENNPNLPSNKSINPEMTDAAKKADLDFLSQHPPIETSIISFDKLNLNAYVYKYDNISHKWSIVVHGYNSSGKWMTRWARNFHEQGYNVLVPDLRGHGNSGGNYIGMGWNDRLDMLLWINKIIEMDSKAEIALFGISMGGATVMMTSGEDLPSNVKVIVEDCGYSSVNSVFAYQLNDMFGLPEFPVMTAANTVTKLRAGYSLYKASAVKQVAKSKLPTLFIHGDKDTFVPFKMLGEVYEASSAPKERLVIKGAAHGQAEAVDPNAYWNTLWSFVNKYIK